MQSKLNESLFPGFSGFQEIGRGSFGIVYKAVHVKTGYSIAIKKIEKMSLITESNRQTFQSELDTYKTIDHPFIAHFYGKIEDKASIYLIMEHVPNGSLLSHLGSHGKMKEADAQKIFIEIMSALRYLHEQQMIVHRDLKIDNILLDSHLNIRIIDFGFSCKLEEHTSLLSAQCGSYPYTAPEIIRKQGYSTPVDIWSAGVDLFSIVCGYLPFSGTSTEALFHSITREEPVFPSHLSFDLKNLLHRLLNKDPLTRITMREIEQHPWIISSRYTYFLSPSFMVDPKYKIAIRRPDDIEESIVMEIKHYGIPCDTLCCDLLNETTSESLFCYKILRKERLLKLLSSPTQIRNMFQFRKIKEGTRGSVLLSTSIDGLMVMRKARANSNAMVIAKPSPKTQLLKTNTAVKCIGVTKIGFETLGSQNSLPALMNRKHSCE